jgi:2,4-dienoyl-CoA reductase-like NADH-dependent reductase (Old Yellow Enzyme family)
MRDFSKLFRPLEIHGKLHLQNRLVMAPMTTVSGNSDGSFSDEEIAYLGRRAESGIGLVMTPACYVHKSGHSFDHQVGCHSDEMLPRLQRCADSINRHGAASFLQIHHGGNAARSEYSGRLPMAPSAVINRRGTSEMPAAMTEDEIWMIIESFALAARRAKAAGFTGIELHGANTYLFQQFFSPFTNKRTDRWGGELRCDRCDQHHLHEKLEICHRLENRARFAVETIKAVRREVGPDYPICYRISPEEADPDGYSTHDAIQLLGLLLPHGIDMVHVSSWNYGQGIRHDWPDGSHPSKMISDSMPDHLPVIGVGSIMHPDQAMHVLDDGLELVALGRALLLDADWAKKVKEGDFESLKTTITSEEERQHLEIPGPMREYTKNSIKVES